LPKIENGTKGSTVRGSPLFAPTWVSLRERRQPAGDGEVEAAVPPRRPIGREEPG
jgi:hypothetical protein